MKLIKDVVSHSKKNVVYGKVGDEVKIIADYGNVLIVENDKGRFPCKAENISEKPLTDLKPITNQVQVKTAKRQKPAPLNKLF